MQRLEPVTFNRRQEDTGPIIRQEKRRMPLFCRLLLRPVLRRLKSPITGKLTTAIARFVWNVPLCLCSKTAWRFSGNADVYSFWSFGGCKEFCRGNENYVLKKSRVSHARRPKMAFYHLGATSRPLPVHKEHGVAARCSNH